MLPSKDELENVELMQRLFVKPMVDAVVASLEAQIKPLVETVASHGTQLTSANTRLNTLESSNKKALLGWGVYATGLSLAFSSLWSYAKRKFGW